MKEEPGFRRQGPFLLQHHAIVVRPQFDQCYSMTCTSLSAAKLLSSGTKAAGQMFAASIIHLVVKGHMLAPVCFDEIAPVRPVTVTWESIGILEQASRASLQRYSNNHPRGPESFLEIRL